MITGIALIIAGLGLVAAAMAVFAHWDEVKKWLRDFAFALKELFVTTLKGVAHAAATFMKVLKDDMSATMHKLYYQEKGQYIEEIRTRVVPQQQLPAWAQQKLANSHGAEVETDNDLQQREQLTLTL